MKIKKNKFLVVLLSLWLLGMIYLVLPEPVIPNLPGALKSSEPGDTTQIPGVWAYYTNLPRREAVDFYKEAFSHSSFLKIPLPTYILNHPPEYARETIRATQQGNFYEELVHPLRESLFINGWTPGEDQVYLAKSLKPVIEFTVDGQKFNSKITLYHVRSPIWARILVWTGVMTLIWLMMTAFKFILFSPWGRRK